VPWDHGFATFAGPAGRTGWEQRYRGRSPPRRESVFPETVSSRRRHSRQGRHGRLAGAAQRSGHGTADGPRESTTLARSPPAEGETIKKPPQEQRAARTRKARPARPADKPAAPATAANRRRWSLPPRWARQNNRPPAPPRPGAARKAEPGPGPDQR